MSPYPDRSGWSRSPGTGRVVATPWRLTPAPVNASFGLLFEQYADGGGRPGSVTVLACATGGWAG